MNPNLIVAIYEYISDEFHIGQDRLSPETDFQSDLHISTDGLSQLLQRLQDSLNFTLPEEKIASIVTIGDLIEILREEDGDVPAPSATTV